MRALALAGVEAEVRARAVEILDGRVTCEGRVLGAMSFRRAGTVLSLPQRETEEVLERRLEELRPGALRRGVEVHGVRDRGTHVEVDGVDVTGGGEASTVGARYAIAADGVRSGIREQLGIAWHPHRGRAFYVMGDTRDDTGEPASALLHFEPAGVVESFPMPGGTRRWVAWVRRPPAVADRGAARDDRATRAPTTCSTSPTASEPSAFEARQHLAGADGAGPGGARRATPRTR